MSTKTTKSPKTTQNTKDGVLVHLKLPEDLVQRLQQAADREGVTAEEITRRALGFSIGIFHEREIVPRLADGTQVDMTKYKLVFGGCRENGEDVDIYKGPRGKFLRVDFPHTRKVASLLTAEEAAWAVVELTLAPDNRHIVFDQFKAVA